MTVEDIHPDAAASFGRRGEELVAEVTPPDPSPPGTFRGPPPHLAKVFESHEIKSIGHLSNTDVAGDETARSGVVAGEVLQLSGDAYKRFVRLAQSIQLTPPLRRTVTLDTVKSLLFDWILVRQSGNRTSQLIPYLQEKTRELVKPYTIIVPTYELALESSHIIGNVELRPIAGRQIDEWMAQLIEQNPDSKDNIHYIDTRWRKRMQGRTSCFYSVEAELARAREMAISETENALAALRLFSPGNFHPRARSTCVPWGREHLVREFTISLENDKTISSEESISTHGGPPFWLVTDAMFQFYWTHGLDQLSALLTDSSSSNLEEDLIKAMLLYSRASLSHDVTEKLLHMFVMLESLLLKDESEPIVASLSERIAFIVGSDTNERLTVSRCVKDAYRLRSKFIHHAAPIDDHDTVQSMMYHAFDCYMGILRNRSNFSDRKELFAFLEERKFK